jgi:acetyl esterase/lipase
MNTAWVVEERMALVPEIGMLLKSSLPVADLREEKVTFGDAPNQYFYLCWPENIEHRRKSAVLFLHGGGWSTGNPFLFRFVGHFFAGLGYPTILGGYRMAPAEHYPAQAEDSSIDLEVGVEALATRGVALDQLIVGGQSAGAHLASLLVYNRALRSAELIAPLKLAGFFSISGPLNFTACGVPSLRKMIADLMGDGYRWGMADPIRFIRGDETLPAFFIHGDRDPLVEMQNTLSFAKRLARSRSCKVDVHLVRGGHHADLATLFLRDQPATRVFKHWLEGCDRP